ncbi:MAG: vapC [Schumannella sp.]|nr:vapC [Schumannella sp.]
MIVFDAGVIIAHTETEDAFHEAAIAFLDANEEFEFAINPLTLAECLVRPAREGEAQRTFHALQRLLFETINVSDGDAVGLAEIRASTGLKMSDALVIHTAERNAAELVTTDRAVARAAEQRGLTAHLLEA